MSTVIEELTVQEKALLDRWLGFYQALASGFRAPSTTAQWHFVEVCMGRAVAETAHEFAFIKYRMKGAKEKLLEYKSRMLSSLDDGIGDGYRHINW